MFHLVGCSGKLFVVFNHLEGNIYFISSIFCAIFFQDVLPNAGLEELIMGLSSQIAEREDSVLCSDVRGMFVFFPTIIIIQLRKL